MKDAAESATSYLLVAQFTGDPRVQDLSRTLTVVPEAQEAHRRELGVYAISLAELEGQMSDLDRMIPSVAEIEVASAAQDRYCVAVRIPDLPPIVVRGPDRRISADDCDA